jgi:hypothetical protein
MRIWEKPSSSSSSQPDLAKLLAGCGLQVKVKSLAPNNMFASEEDTALFGCKFGLALFSLGADIRRAGSGCASTRIPDAANL